MTTNESIEKFQLPIYYLKNKMKIEDNTVDDLELIETKATKSLYSHAFNPKTEFSRSVLPLWAEYYTSDTVFLKESQKFVKKFKNTISFESDAQKALTFWKSIKSETNFKGKYQYLDWKLIEKLNENRYFLEIFSLYNLSSPLFSLILPIIFLIIPFFILKIQGVQITISAYYSLLGILFKKHTLGQIFSGNFSKGELDKKIYIVISFFLYIFQIYQNTTSCIRFYRNMTFIHDSIFSLRNYYDVSIRSMNNVLNYTNKLTTYKGFNKNMIHHMTVIKKLNKELHQITPCRLTLKKALQIGHVMEIFYGLYYNPQYHNTTEYLFKFTGWVENIEGLKQSIKSKKINYCKFTQKSQKFIDAYFPATLETKPVTNTYNINSNMLITGPNAAGKTTLLKTTLFNIIISQQLGIGFYKKANIIPFDAIHCYINIPDTSNRDSLFQAEARRCKDILNKIESSPGKRHFCIFDELYSGTNPYEAISSAVAFLNYLNKHNNINFMLTTHFIDLCKRLEEEEDIINYNMKIETIDDKFKYTYKLTQGISYIKGGVKVLKQLKYPTEIIKNTEKIIETVHL
jgi:hypothetical protein